ncbi:hypothetical protein F7Q99_06555 [Streptomyces kaniharaensis]|uniref:Uncharacterized protein n=1 Tax=Streptomyces kaniharaensis TaxID=212423 RepID=A0A6N7KKA0_9ACTN|nr:hypothetical protein [Streptomyces kaniharaensis]MQS11962.1 hypothetical protein [Streptomyces kaniharaensis]
MNRDDPAFGADEMGALFRTVLDQPEPTAPPALLPEVRHAGGRLRRRRRLTALGATVAAVALLGTAGWAVDGRTAAERTTVPAGPTASASASAAPSPAPSSFPPPPAPWDQAAVREWDRQVNAAGHQALLKVLQAHLPEDFSSMTDGGNSRSYNFTRKDGGAVAAWREDELYVDTEGGQASPCETNSSKWGPVPPVGRDCERRTLPDGSVAWAYHPLNPGRGQWSALSVVTPQNRRYGLAFGRVGTPPFQPTDETIALPQLLDLAAAPGFLEAIRDGWYYKAKEPAR